MKYCFRMTKGYRLWLCGLFVVVLCATGTGALFPWAIGRLVDEIFYRRRMRGFLAAFCVYAGLYLLNQCLHGALNYFWVRLRVTWLIDIRKACFSHLQKLKAEALCGIRSGDVIRRMREDVECFLEFVHRSLFYVAAHILQLGISLGYLYVTAPSMALAALVFTPVMGYTVRHFTAKLTAEHQRIQNGKGLLEAWILEMMAGIFRWKLLGAADQVQRDYREKSCRVLEGEIHAGFTGLYAENLNGALTLLGQLAVYAIAAYRIRGGSMTVGQFVASASYFAGCAGYFRAIGKKIQDSSQNLAGIRRVEAFMGWEEERDCPGAYARIFEKGSIRLEGVSFGYGKERVLHGIDLQIEAGERLALVGKSGEGKSTLLKLLCRLYEPQEGQIFVDGACLHTCTLAGVRSQIAVVWQENGLFHASLRENIALSDDSSQDRRIWEILEGLRLKELAESLPAGLDTVLGEGERSLSGGQKQRIAIARCVFKQPKVLLLDEATSALDGETETAVITFLCEQLPGTTILCAAHRFSAVLAFPQTAVLEQGRISAKGPHAVLMERSGLYRALYEEYRSGADGEKNLPSAGGKKRGGETFEAAF